MSSVISTIYANIKALAITAGGQTPQVFGLADVPNSLASAELPCRILTALQGNFEGQEMRFETISGNSPATGNQQNINWQIIDLLLWLPQAQGRGPRDVTAELVEYAGAYLDIVRPNRLIGTRASVENLSIDIGIYEYPSNSGNFYYGGRAAWTIKELP